MAESNDTLADAQRFQALFVAPLLDLLREKMAYEFDRIHATLAQTDARTQAVAAAMEDVRKRVEAMERSQGKLVKASATIIAAACFVWGIFQGRILGWIRARF
jgi:hypothetical protein